MPTGYTYGQPEPLATCPYCGYDKCTADFTDIGIGNQQTGPYGCEMCHAYEIGPYDVQDITEEEKKTGWYKPQRELDNA